jgi:hypothetical protein
MQAEQFLTSITQIAISVGVKITAETSTIQMLFFAWDTSCDVTLNCSPTVVCCSHSTICA